MILYLMRHGETDWNKDKRLQGRSDVPLNEYGIELAEKTAEGLRHVRFDRIFSSPLQRALTTAQIMAKGREISVMPDEALCEVNFGEDEGQCFVGARKDPAHPLHLFFNRPEAYVPTGKGETFSQAGERARAFLREKIYPLEGQCENLLVVAHGALNRCILNAAAGIPESEFWTFSLPNCAVSVLEVKAGELRILEESKIYYDEPVNGRP